MAGAKESACALLYRNTRYSGSCLHWECGICCVNHISPKLGVMLERTLQPRYNPDADAGQMDISKVWDQSRRRRRRSRRRRSRRRRSNGGNYTRYMKKNSKPKLPSSSPSSPLPPAVSTIITWHIIFRYRVKTATTKNNAVSIIMSTSSPFSPSRASLLIIGRR